VGPTSILAAITVATRNTPFCAALTSTAPVISHYTDENDTPPTFLRIFDRFKLSPTVLQIVLCCVFISQMMGGDLGSRVTNTEYAQPRRRCCSSIGGRRIRPCTIFASRFCS